MGSKQNLVLIPGLVCDQQVWQHQHKFLKDIAEITIIPADSGETMESMAAHALNLAPNVFALAGFSMGGYIALEMLRQAPHRITRLALLDTSSKSDTSEKFESRLKAIAACKSGNFNGVIEGMFEVLLHSDFQQSNLRAFVKDMAMRVGSDTFCLRHKAMMTRCDSTELLLQTKIPVRAICGRQDAMSSVQDHQEIADNASHGKLSIIEECGHMTILERPHAATALLRDWIRYD